MFAELARATETNPNDRPRAQSIPISGSGRDWEIDPTTMLEVRTGISEANMRGDYTDDLELDEDWHDFIARNIDELEAANAAAAVTADRLYTESGLEDAH